MTKLTDTQLLILSKASQRDDRAIELPPNLKGGAARKVIAKLLEGGLVEEAAAGPGQPVWRQDDGAAAVVLVITHLGLEALGIVVDPDPDQDEADERDRKPPPMDSRGPSGRTEGQPAHDPRSAEGAPRSGTKQALILTLLRREQGATLDDLLSATAWLPHTTRAALTGLRKKGYEIGKSKGEDGETVYRIAAGPETGRPADQAA